MKLSEQISQLIREVEKVHHPADENAYRAICEGIGKLKQEIALLYGLMEILKQVDNVQYMMHCYMPKKYYDIYGSNSNPDNERNFRNLERERKRLIITLHKLRSSVEAVGGDAEKDKKTGA